MNTTIKLTSPTAFGRTRTGIDTQLYTLTNENNAKALISTYGATLTELWIPDRVGVVSNVVLGFDNTQNYEDHTNPHFGGTIGRYANRIGGGRFTIDNEIYMLEQNNGPNSLHGGVVGWDRQVWQADLKETTEGQALHLSLVSKDGDEGFPGTVEARVTYTLTSDNALKIAYYATTDKATPLNMTNHAYFNLAGAGNGDVLSHSLRIFADKYTPVDASLIPTGQIESVQNTPLDFTKEMTIGSRIKDLPHGYDHNYVLAMRPRSLSLAARAKEPSSGRAMEVWTTEPGIQLYSAYWLDGSLTGNGGRYERFYAFCLEAQHFPDSPNQPNFPSSVLRPGQEYSQTTIYKFLSE